MTDLTPTRARAAWTEALRSGEFAQGRHQLSRKGTHCCLGVACEVALRHGVIDEYDPSAGKLPEPVQRWLGLRSTEGTFTLDHGSTKYSLIRMNDGSRSTFETIANMIDDTPEGLLA